MDRGSTGLGLVYFLLITNRDSIILCLCVRTAVYCYMLLVVSDVVSCNVRYGFYDEKRKNGCFMKQPSH